MRIDSLKVQNFRCFEHAEFQFSPQFNLLVGVNGSGKTSLLRAVASVLASPINGLVKYQVWPHIDERNARMALRETHARVRYDYQFPMKLAVSGEIAEKRREWWISFEGASAPPHLEPSIVDVLLRLMVRVGQGTQEAMPIVAFYAADRQWKLKGVLPDQAVRQQESRIDAYESWHDAASDLKGFEAWVVAKSLERLERITNNDEKIADQGVDELSLVNQAVAVALPGSSGVRFDIKYRRMVLEWKGGNPPTPFDVLSDGQRGLTALVADIARRMCLLNPQLGNEVLALTPGVVVIDELDIHLHPAWQRRVVQVLKQTFPKIQFFAASHSPQIIGELPADEIILLRDGQPVGHPEYALGLDSAEVLEELMGSPARNKEVTEQLHAIRQAIDNDEINRARELLDTLEAEVGGIPEVLESRSAIQSLQWLEGEGE